MVSVSTESVQEWFDDQLDVTAKNELSTTLNNPDIIGKSFNELDQEQKDLVLGSYLHMARPDINVPDIPEQEEEIEAGGYSDDSQPNTDRGWKSYPAGTSHFESIANEDEETNDDQEWSQKQKENQWRDWKDSDDEEDKTNYEPTQHNEAGLGDIAHAITDPYNDNPSSDPSTGIDSVVGGDDYSPEETNESQSYKGYTRKRGVLHKNQEEDEDKEDNTNYDSSQHNEVKANEATERLVGYWWDEHIEQHTIPNHLMVYGNGETWENMSYEERVKIIRNLTEEDINDVYNIKGRASEVDGNYMLNGMKIGRVTDFKPKRWEGRVELADMPEFAEYGLLDPMAIVEGDDGVTYKDPKGGSDGSRGTLLEPDGSPMVNVTSYDEDHKDDFFNDLFRESKASEVKFERDTNSIKIDGKNVIKVWETFSHDYYYAIEDQGEYTGMDQNGDEVQAHAWYGYSHGYGGHQAEWGTWDSKEFDRTPLIWEVPQSDWIYTGKQDSFEHIANEDEDVMYKCPECDREFDNPAICSTCRSNFKSHLSTMHDWEDDKIRNHMNTFIDFRDALANEGMAECPHCDGEGKIDVDWTDSGIAQCPACNGSGKMDKKLADDYIQNDMDQTSRARSNMYGDDEYIDGSDVPTSGFYESKANEFADDYEIHSSIEEFYKRLSSGKAKCVLCGTIIKRNREPDPALGRSDPNYYTPSYGSDLSYHMQTNHNWYGVSDSERIKKKYPEIFGESKANEIQNYLGIELYSLDELIEKVRNTDDIVQLGKLARYFGSSTDKEDIIENMENYRDADVDDYDVGEFRRILGGVKLGESKANENSNWKAFTNAQRQEIIDLSNVDVSADTEWEDISEPDQEDLSIHLVSQGALASADFTGFADEYVNKIKLDGLNVKNHIKETIRDKIHNWKKMDRDVRKEDSEYAGIDQDMIDTIVDMSLSGIKKEFPEEFKKLDQIGVWGFGESRANEVSAEEEEVANDLWQALGEGGLKSDYINGGIFKFDITYPSWVEDPEMDVSDIMWDELTATDKQNVVNHFGGVEGMKEKLCDEGWDNYCYADEAKANEDDDEYYEYDDDGTQLNPVEYDDDEYIDGSDVPKSGHYESKAIEGSGEIALWWDSMSPYERENVVDEYGIGSGLYDGDYNKTYNQIESDGNDGFNRSEIDAVYTNHVINKQTGLDRKDLINSQSSMGVIQGMIPSNTWDNTEYDYFYKHDDQGKALFNDGDRVFESKANEERSDYVKMIADLNDPSKEVMTCQLCGKESPYVLMNDYWDKHFEAEHGYNIDEGEESKANEMARNTMNTDDDRSISGSGGVMTDYTSAQRYSMGAQHGFDYCCYPNGDISASFCSDSLDEAKRYADSKQEFVVDFSTAGGGGGESKVAYNPYDLNVPNEFGGQGGYYGESKANENVASKLAYYYQKDAPNDWNDNQVSNEAEKILEETYGIKPKKEVVKVEAKESLSIIQQKIVDRKLDGVRNESIIHELKIWDNMNEEQAKKAVETTEIPLQDSVAYTLFNKKYAECNENEIQELKIYAGESKASEYKWSGATDDELMDAGFNPDLTDWSKVNPNSYKETGYSDPECSICGRVMHNSFEQNDDKEAIKNAITRHYEDYHADDLQVSGNVEFELKKQLAKTGESKKVNKRRRGF